MNSKINKLKATALILSGTMAFSLAGCSKTKDKYESNLSSSVSATDENIYNQNVTISVLDIDTKEYVLGKRIGIVDENSGDLIVEFTTTDDPHTLYLVEGNYYVVDYDADEYYTVAFTVEDDSTKVQNVTVYTTSQKTLHKQK